MFAEHIGDTFLGLWSDMHEGKAVKTLQPRMASTGMNL